MTPLKRKRDQLDDDTDEDEPSFGRQILPVANLPEDFDGTPSDGMQYLFTVRRDARYLPHVTRAVNPYEIKNSQPSIQNETRAIPSHTILPSEAWRALLTTRFNNFRRNLKQPTIYVQFTPQNEYRRIMPDKKERDLWWAFLAGKPETEWNPPKKLKQNQRSGTGRQFGEGMRGFADGLDRDTSSERRRPEPWQANDEGEVELVLRVHPTESLPTPTGSPIQQVASEVFHQSSPPASTACDYEMPEAMIKPREPLPSLLRHIDQRMALHLLMYFTHWINLHLQQPDPSSRPIESHARWIFVLLSQVEDYVSADDMSMLRNLARACIALLGASIQARIMLVKPEQSSNPEQDREGDGVGFMSERSCWTIISIIVGVWGQRDLWTDAEDMLKNIGP